jgi:ethanolamine utilization microcompartment shell protein EutS
MEGPEGVSAILAAVIDNRAGEVGLAVLDADGGALLLSQHVEATRTFARTL